MIREFDRLLDRLVNEKARALIVTGAGRGFSSGGDLDLAEKIDHNDLGAYMEKLWNPFVEKMAALPVPIITAVNGGAAGAGCSLALMGDFIVMGKSAYLLLSFIKVGLVADAGATWLLARTVGRQRATRMLMLGERVSAQLADQWGIAHAVVENETVLDSAIALARQLAAGPTLAYGLLRTCIREALDGTLSESLQSETVAQRKAGRSADFKEGLASFHERRPAKFTGT
jgi:2-(1,2-epoxy-1,2-dihydrophenyl)acetyl-CoA isomerase